MKHVFSAVLSGEKTCILAEPDKFVSELTTGPLT